MKKLCSFSLAIILIISFPYAFSSCTNKPDWEPYLDAEIELIYQDEGYTPTVSYMLNFSFYQEPSWSPKFMGFPLISKYYHRYYIINPDLTVVYSHKKLSDEIQMEFTSMAVSKLPSNSKYQIQEQWRTHIKNNWLTEFEKFPELQSNSLGIHEFYSSDKEHFVLCKIRGKDGLGTYFFELSPDGAFLRVFFTTIFHMMVVRA